MCPEGVRLSAGRDSKYAQRVRAMMPTFEEQVLRKILPSPEEDRRIQGVVHDVMKTLEAKIAAKGLKAKPLLVGSVAKGVHLTGTEIDIFVAFPPDTPREVLEREGLALGDLLERPVRMYAEHPYTRGWYDGFEVEIVPCYRITDATQRMSAVDRTPLHVDYVLGHLQENQATEVRLLKAFAGGIGVYGAEAKIRGFSGYLCELLVLKYGTFRGVLEAAKTWHPGTKVEFETPAGRAFNEPFVVVDPVDGNRNVASAGSAERLATLVHAALEYLAKPSDRVFFPRPLKPRSLAPLKATLQWRRSKRRVAGPYIRGERWVVEITREAVDAAALLRKEFRTLSLGRDLDRATKRGQKIRIDGDAVRKPYAGVLSAFYDRRFPWER